MFQGVRVARSRFLAGLFEKIKTALGTKMCFEITLALFVLQAGYIAVRSSFPLAFDESYHLGIIRIHATQWNPFLSHLPNSTGQYGPLATDPSYLYHYLMSFPYRIVDAMTTSTFGVVLAMRFINIAMFAAGLILFRRVLQYSGASKSLINLVLLIFTFIPLETFTAAQINYDNLVFPFVAATLLFALQFVTALRRKNRFEVKPLALLLITGILGSQVKYSYMPIALAVCGLVAFFILKWALTEKRNAVQKVVNDIRQLQRGTVVALAAGLVISSGMLGWRFGYNLATYHSPMPNCSKVLSVQSCMAWGPWARDYQNGLQAHPAVSMHQRIAFAKVWVHIMGDELFTVLNANNGGAMEEPVRQLVMGGVLLAVAGLLFAVQQWRRLKEIGSPLAFFIFASGFYLVVLMLKNYGDYTHYGVPTAIQGRYLLPVMLPVMILIARAYSLALIKFPEWKALVVIGMLVLGSQGGGVLTYMIRTNQSWYWTATTINSETPKQVQATIAENKP